MPAPQLAALVAAPTAAAAAAANINTADASAAAAAAAPGPTAVATKTTTGSNSPGPGSVSVSSSSSSSGSSGRHQLRPVKYDYADSFACTYVVSVVAASIAELVTYPLDLTKTRLQIQGEAAHLVAHTGGGSTTNVSMMQLVLHQCAPLPHIRPVLFLSVSPLCFPLLCSSLHACCTPPAPLVVLTVPSTCLCIVNIIPFKIPTISAVSVR